GTAGAGRAPPRPRDPRSFAVVGGGEGPEDVVGEPILSYEEYHPYGTTAWWAGTSDTEVSAKRYRYTGKERDEETGLSYHGARYYAPWLGRWLSPDPTGLEDGLGPFTYVGGSPISFRDTNGLLRDVEGAEASPSTKAVLAAHGLAEVVEASPTLRPLDVQRAAQSGRLTRFDLHPGSTFLGTVGEGVAAKRLEAATAGGWLPRVLTQRVVHQPGQEWLSDETRAIFGETLPDLLVMQAGFHNPVYRIGQGVRWKNAIGRETGGRVGTVDFGTRSVVSWWEVTTSSNPIRILERAEKVAAWAQGLRATQVNPQVRVTAVLALDRGAYFQLSEVERQEVSKLVTAAGGYIMLFDNLTSESIETTRQVNQEINSSALVP
ncbi:MAG: RHS repeat-associated core domain-containing protein, partial [Myxococcota bacterium]